MRKYAKHWSNKPPEIHVLSGTPSFQDQPVKVDSNNKQHREFAHQTLSYHPTEEEQHTLKKLYTYVYRIPYIHINCRPLYVQCQKTVSYDTKLHLGNTRLALHSVALLHVSICPRYAAMLCCIELDCIPFPENCFWTAVQNTILDQVAPNCAPVQSPRFWYFANCEHEWSKVEVARCFEGIWLTGNVSLECGSQLLVHSLENHRLFGSLAMLIEQAAL